MFDYLSRELRSLQVRVADAGIVTEIVAEVGSRLTRGERLAKVIDPERLRAELEVPQVRARDIRVGQIATIDTRNARIRGVVTRIDPSVQDGVVLVDVDPEEPLPAEARAELRVDGTIVIEELGSVLQLRRPTDARENAALGLFRIEPNDPTLAQRIPVELGRLSVNTVEVLAGLGEGDRVILSDTSQFSDVDRIRLR